MAEVGGILLDVAFEEGSKSRFPRGLQGLPSRNVRLLVEEEGRGCSRRPLGVYWEEVVECSFD
jgi:hypothetical protein